MVSDAVDRACENMQQHQRERAWASAMHLRERTKMRGPATVEVAKRLLTKRRAIAGEGRTRN